VSYQKPSRIYILGGFFYSKFEKLKLNNTRCRGGGLLPPVGVAGLITTIKVISGSTNPASANKTVGLGRWWNHAPCLC